MAYAQCLLCIFFFVFSALSGCFFRSFALLVGWAGHMPHGICMIHQIFKRYFSYADNESNLKECLGTVPNAIIKFTDKRPGNRIMLPSPGDLILFMSQVHISNLNLEFIHPVENRIDFGALKRENVASSNLRTVPNRLAWTT